MQATVATRYFDMEANPEPLALYDQLSGHIARKCLSYMDLGKPLSQLEEENNCAEAHLDHCKEEVSNLVNSLDRVDITPALVTIKQDILAVKTAALDKAQEIAHKREMCLYRYNMLHMNMPLIIQVFLDLNSYRLWTSSFKLWLRTGIGPAHAFIDNQNIRDWLYDNGNLLPEAIKKKQLQIVSEKKRKVGAMIEELEQEEAQIHREYRRALNANQKAIYGWCPADFGLSVTVLRRSVNRVTDRSIP